MLFIKTFKGYEDRTLELDRAVNEWLGRHKVDVVDVKIALSHEAGGRAGTGDLIYTVLYRHESLVQE